MNGIIFSIIFAMAPTGDQLLNTAYSEQDGQVYARQIAYNQPYVHVYGRKSCGNTTRMTKFLKKARIPYTFYSVDDKQAANRLHHLMQQAGIKSGSYAMPVIHVNGKIAINPSPESVRSVYKN